jgi:transposase-like protein
MSSSKTVDQLDAEIKALLAQREAALVASKEADLETVKRLCRQHGFTATQLRGVLKTRAKNKRDDGGVDGVGGAAKVQGKRGRKPKLAA